VAGETAVVGVGARWKGERRDGERDQQRRSRGGA